MNVQTPMHSRNEPHANALQVLRVYSCRPASPIQGSSQPGHHAKTEGEIEGGGTRRAQEWCLHRGWRSTHVRWQRAATARALPQMLGPGRAVFAGLR